MVAVTLWASAFVGIRRAGRDLSAGPLSLGRLAVGALVLGAFMLIRREGLPSRRTWVGISMIGLVWFAVYNVVLNEAERRIDAGTAAMIIAIGPLLIALLAGWLLREGFPARLLIGSGIAFAGSLVIGLATSREGSAAGWGAVLALIAAMAYAAGVVMQKPLLSRASGLQVTWLACTVGALACLPFAPSLVEELSDAGPTAIWWMIYLGVFPTAVAFTAWAYALARTTAGRMASVTYLAPPLAVLLGWAILGEQPPVLALLGGALSLAGVILARRTRGTRGSRGSASR